MSSVFGRDAFGAEHERARRHAADRLAGPLDDRDAGWLEAHLAWCAPCRAVRDEYQAQRLELRSLRLDPGPPPRDLWARTAAALDRERPGERQDALRTGTRAVVRGRNPIPVGAMSGLLVIALVVGTSMLGGQRILRSVPSAAPSGEAPRPAATPFPVPVREVSLFSELSDGSLAFMTGRVDQVCPLEVDVECTSTRFTTRRIVDVLAPWTQSVLESPTRSQVIVVGRSAGGAGVDVYVVPVVARGAPSATSRPDGAPPITAPDPLASDGPVTDEPAASGGVVHVEPGGDGGEGAGPAASVGADPGAGGVPASEPEAATDLTNAGTPPVAGEGAPGGEAAGGRAGPGDERTPEPSASPSPEDPTVPGVDVPIRIAHGVLLVSDIGAYSADGGAFAFTARPADARHGPDVYLWRAGDAEASPLTTDHASVFADWIGDELLISRVPAGIRSDGLQEPVSVLVDPDTGTQRVLPTAPAWRPAVDPTERTAVWWDGPVTRDASGSGWTGTSGHLVLGTWRGTGSAASSGVAVPADVLVEGTVADWQVGWDETGTRLALWVADGPGSRVGRLSLFGIEATTGRIDPEAVLLDRVPAEAGFSIGGGRLAWIRPNEDGSTRVAVVAWTETSIGQVELVPSTERLNIVR